MSIHKRSTQVCKDELCQRISEKSRFTFEDIKEFYDLYHTEVMAIVSAGDSVMVRGFGRYFPHRKQSYTRRIPKEEDVVVIPEHDCPAFRFGNTFRKNVKYSWRWKKRNILRRGY